MASSAVNLAEVYAARKRIAPLIRRTPLILSPVLSEQTGRAIYLKLENLQETGSFKVRGAANKLLSLTEDQRARGVITVSTGNHGRAVSYVAGRLGARAVICMSERVPAAKVRAIRRLGATVEIEGQSYDEATLHSLRLQQEQELTWVDPFDDPWVIAGQGTIGLELLEDLPEIDTAIVPLSGGGLIGGIALALKSVAQGIRVIGVSMERGAVMYHSLRAGRPIELPEEETLADALVGGLGPDNRHTFRLAQQYLDDTLLVGEAEIAAAMVFALEEEHLVIEGGGAVGLAALLHGKCPGLGQHVAVVVSGGNVSRTVLQRVLGQTAPPQGDNRSEQAGLLE